MQSLRRNGIPLKSGALGLGAVKRTETGDGPMAKQKPIVEIRSFGIYTQWDPQTKELPKIVEFTRTIPAEVDVEFGMIVKIKGGKNQRAKYCIDHPGILDVTGKRRQPFDGEVFVKSNDWDFFLGDTIWEPIADKLGTWRLTVDLMGKIVADESFQIVPV